MIRSDLDSIPDYVMGKNPDITVKASANEVSFPPLPSVAKAMATAASEANRYPDMAAQDIRQALAEHLGLSFEQVAVGCGSSALCQQLVQATCNDNDEVIYPWRSFEAYPIFIRVAGATGVAVPLTKEHGNDLDAMADAITDRTRLIFVCNPNNPTGTTISTSEFTNFMARIPENVIVVLDEAYFEFNQVKDTPNAVTEIEHYPNLIGLRTFSKAYGLAGARIGYAFGDPKLISALNKVAIPFSISAIAQAGALASLDAHEEILARIAETVELRDIVAEVFGASKSQGNFIWLPGDNGQELADKLREEGIIIRAFPEGARITITDKAEADRLIQAWNTINS